jgi:16S rRNA (guanine1207-N2)-methyltransferase
MLLESLRTVPAGPVMDFGCGCGVIGAWIHRHWPQSLVRMVDTSAMAIEAAKRTAKIHGMPGDCVFVSDVFSNVNGQFDMIISNPSFQSGHRTDHETAERFLAAAGDHLNPDGILRLVADRFLPYRPLIERHVGRCRTVMEDERFRVYEAMRVFD